MNHQFLKTFFVLTFTCFLSCCFAQSPAYPFNDTSLTFEQRVNDLVSRLTLEEKVGQMLNAAPAIERLNIPAYDWWNEVLHGVARTPYKVTVYPQAIAMAATFDTAAIKLMADYSATEGRAICNKAMKDGKAGSRYVGLTYWTPNINIFRDPRWGRGQETYGEDPFLTSMLGKAFVHGLQGDDPKYLKAAACAKHYAVHSGPEPLRHNFNVDPTGYDLWNTYLPAFKELVVNAKVAGVMCAYNAFKSQPCCGSDQLMIQILRDQWEFSGYVTSDCGGIDDFFKRHKTHANAEEASADAVFHGTDVECGKDAYKSLVQAVKDGKITESKIDESVKRLFMIRFRLGMFDPTSIVKYAQTPESELESGPHKLHALKMARESIVLLKNQNSTLPLSKNIKSIAVLGPNADNSIAVLGNYNGTPSEIVTALAGIKSKLHTNSEVIYEKAINYTNDTIVTTSGDTIKTNFADLANRVKNADAIIFIGGISPQLEGESMKVNYPGFNGGDRTSILLPAVQTALLKALKSTGKPVVFVMMTGSAIAIPWEAENIPAIVNAWYGGQSAGTALADVLFGDYNPSGRLPVTFYKSDQDLPDFTDYRMDNRTYRYFKGQVLYGFGFGLSYTRFVYSGLKLPAVIKKGKNVSISVTVKNEGKVNGEEVVQLYVSGNARLAPLRSLKGFKRISLKAGESGVVSFELTPGDLSVMDGNGKAQPFSGKVTISIGGCQPDAQVISAKKVVQANINVR
jgi:beta-glucosidase